MKYLLSLGSNQGPRIHWLKKACTELMQLGSIRRRSAIYETDAFGVTAQPAFLNALCYLETSYRPFHLLWKLKAIELKLGRTRSIHWGPRRIDLDIIDYNGERIQTDILTIPHREAEKRKFILIPLHEINPAYRNRSGTPVQTLINDCRDAGRVQPFNQQW